MTKTNCQIIPFPKDPKNPDESIQITFDEPNFLMPLFVHLCDFYGIPCEITKDEDDPNIVYGNVDCSQDYYHKHLFPKFETLAMKLTDSFQEVYAGVVKNIPLLLQE